MSNLLLIITLSFLIGCVIAVRKRRVQVKNLKKRIKELEERGTFNL